MQSVKAIGGPLYQWEIGRVALVTPRAGHEVTEVHFEDPQGGDALEVEVKKVEGVTLVEIPNILLQSPMSLHAYVVSCSEDCERTLCDCVLPVIPRPKPAGYVYTETEVKSYDALAERISTLEKGGASDDAIAKAVEAYLTEHPPSVTREEFDNLANTVKAHGENMGDVEASLDAILAIQNTLIGGAV